jgi:hypothetical protein
LNEVGYEEPHLFDSRGSLHHSHGASKTLIEYLIDYKALAYRWGKILYSLLYPEFDAQGDDEGAREEDEWDLLGSGDSRYGGVIL